MVKWGIPIIYLYGESSEREKIYNEYHKKPLIKMVESLIKRYRWFIDDNSFEDLRDETFSHVLNKYDKFNPTENKKAYSYYGTVAVNYLKAQRIKHSKGKNRDISYEDISSSLEEDGRYIYEMEIEDKIETYDFIKILVEKLKEEIENNDNLKQNDIKVGWSIIELLQNWESLIDPDDKTNMASRNRILYQLRESSFLNSKEVRNALKKYKSLYNVIKNDVYHND